MSRGDVPPRLVLFYKHLTEVGGAERLIANEFKYLTELGIDVYLAGNRLDDRALFGIEIPDDRKRPLNARELDVPRKLAQTLRSLGNPPVLCSSGHIDVFLASLLSKTSYALHIHHPNYMSFNDFDKYSLFMSGMFEHFCDSNFGAARFREIKKNLSNSDILGINARAALSVWAHRRARAIFVLSHSAQREKKALYGVNALVRMGALDDQFEARLRSRAAARRSRRDEQESRVLTVARLDRNKRIDTLIRAIALLKGRGLAVKLDVAGRGPELEPLMQLAASLGVSDDIIFHGYVDDAELESMFFKADIFASIDWADYKLTLFEALSHGIPVLVSDETEVDLRLLASGQVVLVKPEPETVVEQLESMLAQPPQLDVNGLVMTLRDYTWRTYFGRLAADLVSAGLITTPAMMAQGGDDAAT